MSGSTGDVARPVLNSADAKLIKDNIASAPLESLIKRIPPREEYQERLELALDGDEKEYLALRKEVTRILLWRLKENFGV